MFSIRVLDVKPKLYFAFYNNVSLWPLKPMNTLVIAHNVLEALGRLANYIKIVTGI